MLVDNAATTYCLVLMGEAGAIIIGVYLFITFGNGFRYGRAYLHASQALMIFGFGLVVAFSEYWRTHTSLAIGVFLACLTLPFYVGVLAQRIEEARRRADAANVAKGRFLANMSHEMRTPLNGVIAMADVLRETPLSESQHEIVDTMTTSAHLLLAQIEDVLDLAKIEAGRVTIERRAFQPSRLLPATVKVILPQARYKGLAVNVDIASDISGWFLGDAHHLRQVVLNLLSNAVKFTDRGEVALRAHFVPGQGDIRNLRIEVRDTGVGIPADKQALIFEPFTQADDSITRLYGGTGLGTTIARHLTNQMGGSIGLESAVGAGSLFWIEVPLERTEEPGLDLSAPRTGCGPRNRALSGSQPTWESPQAGCADSGCGRQRNKSTCRSADSRKRRASRNHRGKRRESPRRTRTRRLRPGAFRPFHATSIGARSTQALPFHYAQSDTSTHPIGERHDRSN